MANTQVLKILEEDTPLFKLLLDHNSKNIYFKDIFLEVIRSNLEIKNNEAIAVLLMEIYKTRMQHNEILEIIKKKYNINGYFNYNINLDNMTLTVEYL